ASKRLLEDVFEVCDRKWRGVGLIPKSGLRLRYEYRDHDAERLFEVDDIETQESALCISGQVLKGLKKPHDCPAFGKQCTPQTPLGATMASAEGACATYYAYGRHLEAASGLAEAVLEACPATRCMRYPTRGGLSSVLNELATASRVGVELDEAAIPLRPE